MLVTGAAGYLGQALVQQLPRHKVIALDRQTCDLSRPEAIVHLSSYPIDYIFHLAGRIGVMASWQNPADFYRNNVDTTRNLLEVARLKKIPMHYVSAYVYGNQIKQPISEEALCQPNNPYAHSKYLAEEMCRFYHRHYQVAVTISRPFNIYGGDQTRQMFIPSIVEQILHKEEVQMNDLAPRRDYVHIDDVVQALLAIMAHGKPGEVYNIGTGSSYSCKEVIALLQKLAQTQKPVISKNNCRPEEILDTRADLAKIQADTGWRPALSLEEGLTKVLLSQLLV
jgi:nucleoside-diphosphate-sugar epimerase